MIHGMRSAESKSRWDKQRGFTMIELMVATVILLIGIVAVAQLVPASIVSNSANRYDSSALVFAQRELNQMVGQPLNNPVLSDPLTCPAGCLLGDPAQPDQVVGSPVVVVNNQAAVNFSAGQVAGYNFSYQDPNDPVGVTYDVRWAVITTVNPGSGAVTSKRFIVGALKRGGNGFFRAVTLDTLVAK